MFLKTRLSVFAIPLLVLLLPLRGLPQSSAAVFYTISTIAGNNANGSGYTGDTGPAIDAQLWGPSSVVVDSSGNIYICDEFNNVIREVTTDGNINTIAGNGQNTYSGDAAAANGTNASFNRPTGLAIDSNANIFVADLQNDVIRKFKAAGNLSTVAGNYSLYLTGPGGQGTPGGYYAGDGGTATSAMLNYPYAVAVAANGDIYIADTYNNRIRLVSASSGNITTIAGNGTQGFAGDGGAAISAHLNMPRGVVLDRSGNVYIADTGNNKIRKVSGGAITTVAGIPTITGEGGYSGDNGPANLAQLNQPRGLALDSAGNLYIADYANQRIRVINSAGIINTIAGTGQPGYSGDGGTATAAQLFFPAGIALDAAGNLYVADSDNNVIRMLTASAAPGGGQPPSVTSVINASGFGGGTNVAPGSWIEIYGSNLAPPGDVRSWSLADFNGANAPTQLDRTTVTIGGQSAYVSYISPTQVNAEIPANLGLGYGPQQVVVSTAYGTSQPMILTVNQTQPELLAIPEFKIGGVQYTVATFTDFTTFVLPTGSVPGLTSRPAKPGDTIVLYGVGFGAVTGFSNVPENLPAGQIIEQSNSLITPVQFVFGSTPAPQPLGYAGLEPNVVGLYQFNVTVPNLSAPGAVPLSFLQGSTYNNQTLYVAIGN